MHLFVAGSASLVIPLGLAAAASSAAHAAPSSAVVGSTEAETGHQAQALVALERSAWGALVASDGALATSLSAIDRYVLQQLTPNQLGRLLDGAEASEVSFVVSGESLQELLDRMASSGSAGLAYRPLRPCRLLEASPLFPGETMAVRVGEPKGEPRSGPEAAVACGVPGLRGRFLRTNTARAVLVSLDVSQAGEGGAVALWPAEVPTPPEGGWIRVGAGGSSTTTLVVPLCGEIALEPCRKGDLFLRSEARADVSLTVLVYFGRLDAEKDWGSSGSRVGPTDTIEQSPSHRPLWYGTSGLKEGSGHVELGKKATVHIQSGDAGSIAFDGTADDLVIENSTSAGITLFTPSDSAGYLNFADPEDNDAAQLTYSHLTEELGINLADGGRLMTLKAGKVGVGTRDPSRPLHVLTPGGVTPALRLETEDSTDSPTLELFSPDRQWRVFNRNSGGEQFQIQDATAGAERLVIDSQGRVGIATTSPTAPLSVGSSSTGEVALLSLRNDHGEVRFLVKGRAPSTENAPVGSLYIDSSAGRIYINKDGGSAWVPVDSQSKAGLLTSPERAVVRSH